LTPPEIVKARLVEVPVFAVVRKEQFENTQSDAPL
jgi:hypothetical protein